MLSAEDSRYQYQGQISIQILTAQEDDGGNYHSLGTVHTGPTIIPSATFHYYPIIEQSIFVLYTSYIRFLYADWLKLHYVAH